MSAYYVLTTEGDTKWQEVTEFALGEREDSLVVTEDKYIEIRCQK